MNQIIQGNALAVLEKMPDESVHCCVTSPPYWGLRDYGVEPVEWLDGWVGQYGLEPTPEMYASHTVLIFREVRRVLRKDGTLWLNLGDSYAGSCKGMNADGTQSALSEKQASNKGTVGNGTLVTKNIPGLKSKDLCGIPWRVAFALQADGWYLRQDIIWHKPNPMPESVRDRCTKAHEYIFMLSKSARYYYDADAIREPSTRSSIARLSQNIELQTGYDRIPGKTNGKMKAVGTITRKELPETQSRLGAYRDKQRGHGRRHAGFNARWDLMTHEEQCSLMRNKRSVWTIATRPFKEAHFATFPPDLITPCILAGCPEGGIVLDPFIGAGTTALVAMQSGRKFIGIELNAEYIAISNRRIEPYLTQGNLFHA